MNLDENLGDKTHFFMKFIDPTKLKVGAAL